MATGRAALLLWVQKCVEDKKLTVTNFSGDFQNGMVFCAIIHHHHPSSINYNSLNPKDALKNNQIAFSVGERLGIPQLLDAEDMLIPKPDAHSVMTYVITMHKVLAKGQASNQPFLGKAAQGQTSTPQQQSGGTVKKSPSETKANRGTVAVPNCIGCGSPLRGEVVEFNNKLYHQGCFKCSGCAQTLARCININGKPHCEPCARKDYEKQRTSASSELRNQKQQQQAQQSQPLPPQPQAQPQPSLPQLPKRGQSDALPNKPHSQPSMGAPSQPTKPQPLSHSQSHAQSNTKALPSAPKESPTLPSRTVPSTTINNNSSAQNNKGVDTGSATPSQSAKSLAAKFESQNQQQQEQKAGLSASKGTSAQNRATSPRTLQTPKEPKSANSGTNAPLPTPPTSQPNSLSNSQQNRGSSPNPFTKNKSTNTNVSHNANEVQHSSSYRSQQQPEVQSPSLPARDLNQSGSVRSNPFLAQDKKQQQQQGPSSQPPSLPTQDYFAASRQPLPPQPQPPQLPPQLPPQNNYHNAQSQPQYPYQPQLPPQLPPQNSQQHPPQLPPQLPPQNNYTQPQSHYSYQPQNQYPSQPQPPQLPPQLPPSQNTQYPPQLPPQLPPQNNYNQTQQYPPQLPPQLPPSLPPRLPAQDYQAPQSQPSYPYNSPLPNKPISNLNSAQPLPPSLPPTQPTYALNSPTANNSYNNNSSTNANTYNYNNAASYPNAQTSPTASYTLSRSQSAVINVIEDYGAAESETPQPLQPTNSASSLGSSFVTSPRQQQQQTQQNFAPLMSTIEEDEEWTNYRKSLIQQTTIFSFDEYADGTLLQGFLKKKDMTTTQISSVLGIANPFSAKQFWFNLRSERLLYWNKQPTQSDTSGHSPEGIISLKFCQKIEPIENSLTGFKIVLPEREYELEASSAEERTKWINGLTQAVDVFSKIQNYTEKKKAVDNTLRKEDLMDLRIGIFGWIEHYLILVDGMILMYYGKNGPRLYKVALYGSTITNLDSKGQPRWGFNIQTEGGTSYAISSKNQAKAEDWLNAITIQKNNIEEAINEIVM